MKNLITGIALATAGALMAQAPMMGAKAASGMGSMMGSGMFGQFRLSFGLSALMSKKSITTTTTMTTKYKAGYLYAPDGQNTIGQDRGVFEVQSNVPMTGMQANQSIGIGAAAPAGNSIVSLRVNGVQVAFNNVNGNPAFASLTPAVQAAGLKFLQTGKLPTAWVQVATNNTNGNINVSAANAGVSAALNNPTWDQMMLGALAADGYTASATRTGVKEGERTATAETATKYDLTTWGIRPEVRVGYCVMDELEIFIGARYAFDLTSKDNKDNEKTAKFEAQKVEADLKAQDTTTAISKVDLIKASFAYNKGLLASDVTVKTAVQETVSIHGGLVWQPALMLKVFGFAGVKRYTIEVSYQGGDYAYPGTVGMYADTYTKANNRYKLLISRKDTTRTLKATAWPFTFGGGVSVCFMEMHNITLGMEYASFTSEIKPEDSTSSNDSKDDSSKDNSSSSDSGDHKDAEIKLSNPYDADPTLGQWVNGTGTHQFTGTDVTNRIAAKVEVSDFTFTAGYTLTL